MEGTLKLILDKLNNIDSDINNVKKDVKNLGEHVVIIENEHGAKLDSLLKVK